MKSWAAFEFEKTNLLRHQGGLRIPINITKLQSSASLSTSFFAGLLDAVGMEGWQSVVRLREHRTSAIGTPKIKSKVNAYYLALRSHAYRSSEQGS